MNILSVSTLIMGSVVLIYVGFVTYKQLALLRGNNEADIDTAPLRKKVLGRAGMVAGLVLLMIVLTVRF